MKYNLEYISVFFEDILEVETNLIEYPQKLKRIFSQIDKILVNLVDMPHMYPVYQDFPLFRKITIEDYLLFYAVAGNTIEVHRLIYHKMDMQRIFDPWQS